MITYGRENFATGRTPVYLDGKKVGEIRMKIIKGNHTNPVWFYKPNGRPGGNYFASFALCKQSLESDS